MGMEIKSDGTFGPSSDMKVYSFEKGCSVKSNGNFIEVKIYCDCWADPEHDSIYTNISVDNQVVGKEVLNALSISRDLGGHEYDELFTKEAMKERFDNYIKKLCEKFGYKSKNIAFKNMMNISIDVKENKKLRILPTIHDQLDGWGYFETREEDIYILYNSPPEIIGAAVRYAFSRCKGKGSYAKGAEIVTKALFPDGVPNSLEEYLESIDPGYKKWLIYE